MALPVRWPVSAGDAFSSMSFACPQAVGGGEVCRQIIGAIGRAEGAGKPL
jgi:hypothetical protein